MRHVLLAHAWHRAVQMQTGHAWCCMIHSVLPFFNVNSWDNPRSRCRVMGWLVGLLEGDVSLSRGQWRNSRAWHCTRVQQLTCNTSKCRSSKGCPEMAATPWSEEPHGGSLPCACSSPHWPWGRIVAVQAAHASNTSKSCKTASSMGPRGPLRPGPAAAMRCRSPSHQHGPIQ